MAADMAGSKAGTGAYLGYYKKALKQIDEGLDEETRMEYQAQAKKWTEQKPPHWQQQWYIQTTLSVWQLLIVTNRMFKKYGVPTLTKISKTLYCQFGVQVAILVGYSDREGDPTVLL
jgi:hypothetical protein